MSIVIIRPALFRPRRRVRLLRQQRRFVATIVLPAIAAAMPRPIAGALGGALFIAFVGILGVAILVVGPALFGR